MRWINLDLHSTGSRAYKLHLEKRRDLSQDIHFQLWRSFRHDGRCSLRTGLPHCPPRAVTPHVIGERRIFESRHTGRARNVS